MSELDDFLGVGAAQLVEDLPFGHDVGSAGWLDALMSEQIAQATETPADYRQSIADGVRVTMIQNIERPFEHYDDDLDVDDEAAKAPVTVEPLPLDAGIAPAGRRVWRGVGVGWVLVPGEPEPRKVEENPDELTLRIRQYLAEKKGA